MRQIDAHVRAGGNGPESGRQLALVDPDLCICCVQELIQTACMIQMKMADDDFLDILDLVSSCLNRRTKLMAGLIVHPGEDIRCDWTPHYWIILAAARLPEDQPLDRVLNQDTVHWHLPALIDERFTRGTLKTRVATASDEGFVAFEPTHFQDMELGARRTHIGHRAGHCTFPYLICDGCHFVGGSIAEIRKEDGKLED